MKRVLTLCALMAALGGGCTTNKVIIKEPVSELTFNLKSGYSIEYIIQHPRNIKSGGKEIIEGVYDDGFQIGAHTFGVKTHALGNRLTYISVFADNICLVDFYGDGVDSGGIFAENYHPITGNKGNTIIKEIPVDGNGSNPKANELQARVLEVIVEKYKTGNVSMKTLKTYETAKSSLLDSLK